MGGRKVRRQVHLKLLADNEIDPGLLREALHARLGITAGYGDEGMGRVFQCFADQVARGTFGVLRHRTGIEDQYIRRLAELDELKPLSPESFSKDRGFGLIQPAAERM